TLIDLAPLLLDMHVKRHAAPPRFFVQRRDLFERHAANAVRRDAERLRERIELIFERLDVLPERALRLRRETLLRGGERLSDAAGLVVRDEQHDANAGIARGAQHELVKREV